MHSGRALREHCPSVEVVEHFFVTALSPRDAVSAGDGSQEDSGTASSIRMRSRSSHPVQAAVVGRGERRSRASNPRHSSRDRRSRRRQCVRITKA